MLRIRPQYPLAEHTLPAWEKNMAMASGVLRLTLNFATYSGCPQVLNLSKPPFPYLENRDQSSILSVRLDKFCCNNKQP